MSSYNEEAKMTRAKNDDRSPETLVEELAGRLPFIQASDMTSIARGMSYRPRFGADYVAKLKTGKVTAVHTSGMLSVVESTVTVPKKVGAFIRLLGQFPNDLLLVRTAEDVVRAEREGKIGLIMHFHSPAAIEDDIGLLWLYHHVGLRVMQLTYQGRSLVGDGCAEPKDGGLSSFGIRVVEEMNKLGILIDLSHAGSRTFMEAVEISKVPVINSHGCVRGLMDGHRNLSDEQIKAMAKKGGVLGIMSKPHWLTPKGATEGAGLEEFLDNIEYVIKLVGVDYVGIGLEAAYGVDAGDRLESEKELKDKLYRFGEQSPMPKNMRLDWYLAKDVGDDITTVKRNLIRGLLKRGHTETDIGKILAGNFMRVYRQVWKA